MNIHKMEVEDYRKILVDDMTSNYQNADNEILDEIKSEACILTSRLNLADKVQRYARKPAFFT